MKKQLMDVVQRGPLATIDELEKDLIWRFRFDRFYYHLDRSIPVTVHCEGTVEAISMGFEHCTSSALNFTLNSASRLFCPRTRSRGCVNAHARQLIGERERSQLTYTHTPGVARILSDTPGYAVVSRDFCKVYSYHDALPNHQLGRSTNAAFHLVAIGLVNLHSLLIMQCIRLVIGIDCRMG